jgi:hypothetical protein
MTTQTPRLGAPYIITSQSQKEVTHNMALNILDAFTQTAAETSTLSAPPASPLEGNLWLVSSGGTGSWLGHDNELTQFIGGAWQFYLPFEGMSVWLKDENLMTRYFSGQWQKGRVMASRLDISGLQVIGAQQAAIVDATGGVTIDVEARTALNSLLAACRTHGLIAP